MKRYATVKELSAYTGLPTGTIYDLAAQKCLPSIRIGKRILFDLEKIDAVLASKQRDCFSPEESAKKIFEEQSNGGKV